MIHGGHVQSGEHGVSVVVKVSSVPKSTRDRSTRSGTSGSARSRDCVLADGDC